MRVKERTAKMKKIKDALEVKQNSFKKIFNKMQIGDNLRISRDDSFDCVYTQSLSIKDSILWFANLT